MQSAAHTWPKLRSASPAHRRAAHHTVTRACPEPGAGQRALKAVLACSAPPATRRADCLDASAGAHRHAVKAVVGVAADLGDAQGERALGVPREVPLQNRRLLRRQRRQHLRTARTNKGGRPVTTSSVCGQAGMPPRPWRPSHGNQRGQHQAGLCSCEYTRTASIRSHGDAQLVQWWTTHKYILCHGHSGQAMGPFP